MVLRLGWWAYLPHQKENPPSQEDSCEAGCQQVLRSQPWIQVWGFLFRMWLQGPRLVLAQELGKNGLSLLATFPLTLLYHPVQGWANWVGAVCGWDVALSVVLTERVCGLCGVERGSFRGAEGLSERGSWRGCGALRGAEGASVVCAGWRFPWC